MIYGTESRGSQRKNLLNDRDERILEHMRRQRPVASIAEIEGLEPLYCRKATHRLAAEHGLEYVPEKEQPGWLLSDQSRPLRNYLGDLVYDLRNQPGRHPLEVCPLTGLTQSEQILAIEKGGRHDYKVSQIERIIKASDRQFKKAMLRALLTREEFAMVSKCLNI